MSKDSANILVKEIQMQDVQVYLENRPQIVIPLPIIEAANNKGEPREVFNKIKIKDIISFME